MLKHHLLFPHYSKQNNSEYIHYLSLGSHTAPYQLESIAAFSIVTLHKHQRIPQLHNNPQQQYRTAVVPLKGIIKVDGSSVEARPEKQIISDPLSISNQTEESVTFAYIAFYGQQQITFRLQLSRIGQNKSKVDLNKQLFYLIDGKFTYSESQTQLTVKNKGNFQHNMPALYAVEPIEIELESSSLYLTINDSV